MKKTLMLIIGFLGVLSLSAQQKKTYSFSLNEAVQFALDSSYTAQNANKEVAKALKQKWETTAVGLPQINGEATYNNFLEFPVSLLPANAFNPAAPEGQLTAVAFGVPRQAQVTATLTQLIFDGSYLVGLKAASVFVDYTNTQKERQDLQIIEGVTNSYGGVLLTKESIKVLQSNIQVLEKNLSDLKQVFENGFTEEENVEQLQITLLQLKNQLNNTKRLDAIAQQMLKISLGIPVSSELVLTDNLEAVTSSFIGSDLVFKDFDISKNNDFKLSELLVEQRELEYKLEKVKALPSLGAFANFGVNTAGFELSDFNTNQRWYSSSVIGAKLNVPIFSSFAYGAKTKRAKLSFEQAQTSHQQATDQLKLAHQEAKSNFEFAIDNLNTLKENLSLAERIENKNQIKFNEGLASSFDLRQAQTQLYAAQQEYLQAQLQVIQNKAKLQSVLNVRN